MKIKFDLLILLKKKITTFYIIKPLLLFNIHYKEFLL